MKIEQQQQAETLYMKTNLSKSEIAELVGVNRRTIHYWTANNDWDRLKKSVQNMPSLSVENMYLILAKLQEQILSPGRAFKAATYEEVKMLSMLGNTIKKLEKRSPLNETIELRNHFMEFVNQKNPEMALEVQTLIDGFIKTRAKVQPHNLMAGKIDELGCIPTKEEDIKEAQLDIEDHMYWSENPEQFKPTEEPEVEPCAISPSPLGEGRGEASCVTSPSSEPALSSAEREPALSDSRRGEACPDLSGACPDLSGGRGEALYKLNTPHQIKPLNRAQRRELERISKKKNQKAKTIA